MNKSIIFLNEIDTIWSNSIPKYVFERARRSLLDYLAVTCAGARFQENKLTKYWQFAEPEEGAFRAIGTGNDLVLIFN